MAISSYDTSAFNVLTYRRIDPARTQKGPVWLWLWLWPRPSDTRGTFRASAVATYRLLALIEHVLHI
jgi:hypothetical protein